MKIKMILVLLLAGASLSVFSNTSECQTEIEGDYCATTSWIEGPYIDAYSVAEVSVFDKTSGEAVRLANMDFKTWMIMDMHEHGGAEVLVIEKSKGRYLIDEIYFFSGMRGLWQLRLVFNGIEYSLYEKEI